MSYRLDSDIFLPFGETFEIATGNVIAPSVNVKWRKPGNDFYGKQLNRETSLHFRNLKFEKVLS